MPSGFVAAVSPGKDAQDTIHYNRAEHEFYRGSNKAGGLEGGITRMVPAVDQAMARIAGAVTSGVPTTLPAALTTGGMPGLGVGAMRTVGAAVGPTTVHVTLQLTNQGVIGSRMEAENWLARALDNLRAGDVPYLLTTTFPGCEANEDIATGDWRPLNLERPPFSFPPPLALVDEQCSEGGGQFRDKSLGLWRVDDLTPPRGRGGGW